MKLALVFLLVTLVAISQQQFQYNKVRPRGLFWLSPYYSPQQGVVKSYQHSQQQSAVAQHYYNDFLQNQDQVPLRNQQWKPSTTRIGEIQEIISFFKNNEDDLNPAGAAVIFEDSPNMVDDEQIDESDENTQARIKFYQQNNKNNGGRFFGSTTINNPFIKTATFTLTSTVTTVGSIVTCVPVNNLVAVPAPTCAGRKRRHSESEDSDQFPISPSETLKLMPTVLPSLDSTVTNNRESRRLSMEHFQMLNPQGVSSSKDEISPAGTLEDDPYNPKREKRFFGGGVAASKTVTSYSFIGATLTSTVLLDPTAGGLAACLPAGYVVCP